MTITRKYPQTAFRTTLSREWDWDLPDVHFICLNPSTATDDPADPKDDPTTRKIRGFATRLGYGGFVLTNLSDFRATDPYECKARGWPQSEDNLSTILDYAERRTTIVAWGMHAPDELVVPLMMQFHHESINVYSLAVTKHGKPRHPLMLGYKQMDYQPWRNA